MRFDVKKREQRNISLYSNEDVEIARKFARIMYREFGTFISCLVMFGSAAQRAALQPSHSPRRDIDVLIVLDDVRVRFTRELIETYRIITERAIADTNPERLHVQSMKLTSFWEYMRAGDPLAVNILRSGVALIDTGFFDPLQALLDQGRIRPSDESIWTYFTMAPSSLSRAQQHLLTAMVDLYWAAIDSAHSALMAVGEIPPSPSHVAEMIEKRLVNEGHISRRSARTMEELYNIFKKIIHREIKSVSGRDYDDYRKKAEEFVNEMKAFIENRYREKT